MAAPCERPRAKTLGVQDDADGLLSNLLEENRLLKSRNEELEQAVCLLRIQFENRRHSFNNHNHSHAPLTPPHTSTSPFFEEETPRAAKRRFEGSAKRDLMLLRRASEDAVPRLGWLPKFTLLSVYLRFYLVLLISVMLVLKKGPRAQQQLNKPTKKPL